MTPLTKVTITVLWTAGLLVATPAAAQQTAGAGAPAGVRPIEVSFGGAAVTSTTTSGGSFRVSVTLPVRKDRSLEIFGGPYLNVGDVDSDLGGIRATYGFQWKRYLDAVGSPRLNFFVTSGFEGVVLREQVYDCYGSPVCGPHNRTYALPPLIWLLGGGAQKVLSPHCALRIEAQAVLAWISLGVRAGVSLSIPLGQVYQTAPRAVLK